MTIKKILTTLIAVTLITTFSIDAFADDGDSQTGLNMIEIENNMHEQIVFSVNQKDSSFDNVVSDCLEIAQSQINLFGDTFSISSVSELYNSIGELVALCFNFMRS